MFKNILLIASIFFHFAAFLIAQEKSTISFSFDDGNTKNILNFENAEWNQMILDNLSKHNLQAIFYICGKGIDNDEGKKLLEKWNNAGHLIANHTYSHLNYNKEEVSYNFLKEDILKCDSLINNYKNYAKFFRAPFLKNGDTEEKRDSLISFLIKINYKNGYVTIDNSEWYYNSKLIQALKKDPNLNLDIYRKAYIQHLLEQAKYYDNLAFEILGRKIKHSILLHHNLTSALFLSDLIEAFKNDGWNVINASEALKDEVYKKKINILPAGESIIWSLAKETGKYDDILRYPGEDSIYEEEKLKKLGL
ncbi:MAG: polysaccharide deacetylase family protein [Ignavibacteriales bacterium]|nr:polysaccharide deacetylase family protein [Ignavibacteriales bacterium]